MRYFRAHNHEAGFLASLAVPDAPHAPVVVDSHGFEIPESVRIALRRGARLMAETRGAAAMSLDDGTWINRASDPYFAGEVQMVRRQLRASRVLGLAEERGLRGLTFATAEELATPGYDAAYRRGVARRPSVVIGGLEFDSY